MQLIDKVELISSQKVGFIEKDLGDKLKIELLIGNKKVDGGFIMKNEKSNTTEIELKESLLLEYCMNNDYGHLI